MKFKDPEFTMVHLEPVLRACLLPFGGFRSPQSPMQLQSRFWSRFLRLYKRVIALQTSLDYQSQPITEKSPEES